MGKRTGPEQEPTIISASDIDAALADSTPIDANDHGDAEQSVSVLDRYEPAKNTERSDTTNARSSAAGWRSVKDELAQSWGVTVEAAQELLFRRIVSGHHQTVTKMHIAQACIFAQRYDLNPLLNHVYFFLSKDGTNVVPVVGVDGWAYIVAKSNKLDGLSFEYSEPGSNDPWCKCTMWLKGCRYPIVHTEFLSECKRQTDPWKNCPRRMLRNRGYCQTGRIALGIGGIYEEDEALEIAGLDRAPTAQTKAAELTNRLTGAAQ